MKHYLHSSLHLIRLILRLLCSPSFIAITLLGNITIAGFSLALYLVEWGLNDSIQSPLDALWWGFATATTVGYGDIIPVTPWGKVIGIALMLTGTGFFAIYTGLFAQTILEDDLLSLGGNRLEKKR